MRGLGAVALVAGLLALRPATATAQVDPSGSWRTVRTAHFRIHYPTHLTQAADHTAREAERAYALLATELTPPRGVVDVVISDAADFANGFASVFPSPSMVLLMAQPMPEPGLEHHDDWVRLVMVHELTHIFHLDRVRGPWGLAQAVLGRLPGSFPNAYQPSWVTEGLATYYESRFTGGGRVRGSFHTQVLAAAAAGRRWPTPSEATLFTPRWPDGLAPYAFGSRFLRAVAQPDEGRLGRLVERTGGQWIPWRTGRPLRLAAATPRDSLWRALRRDYLVPAQATRRELIARGLRDLPAPAVAPSGRVAYVAVAGDQAAAIVVRETDGRERRMLTTGGVDLAWHGDTLYATRLELYSPTIFRSNLYRWAGAGWTQLTRDTRLRDLAATPDGIVAVELVGDGSRLVRWRAPDAPLEVLTRDQGNWATPAGWGAAGLVAVHQDSMGRRLVRLGAGAEPASIAGAAGGVVADPVLSPDGAWLLFTDDGSGLPQVYARATDGGAVRQVTAEPTGARQPAPSVDGWLYYTTLEADGYTVVRCRWRETTCGGTVAELAAADLPPVRAPAPADPAPAVPAETRGYDFWPALRPHYLLPTLRDRGSAGFFVGGRTSGRDPVGRVHYQAAAAVGVTTGLLNGELGLQYTRWRGLALDVYLSHKWGDAGIIGTTNPVAVRRQSIEADLGTTLSWRRWRRWANFRLGTQLERDRFTADTNLRFRAPSFLGGSATLSLGRVVTTPLGISTEDGASAVFFFRRRWRLDRVGWSNEWRGRLALYQAIKGWGGFAHPVLAARVSGGWTAGPDRPGLGVGGISSQAVAVVPGVVLGGTRSFPLRGYAVDEVAGTRVVAAAAEFRLPLALVARPLGGLPLAFDRVSLTAFYDYGRAWNPRTPGTDGWIHSAGVEVVWDLAVSYDLPFRLRTIAAVPLRDGRVTRSGRVRLAVAAGVDF